MKRNASKKSTFIKPSWLLSIVLVINIFASALMMIFDVEGSQINDFSAYTGLAVFVLIPYFILTRFNKVRIISKKIRIVQSEYYNALLVVALFSYLTLPFLYWALNEESKEYINFLYLLLIPIYIAGAFHFIYLIGSKIPTEIKQNDMFLPIKQRKLR